MKNYHHYWWRDHWPLQWIFLKKSGYNVEIIDRGDITDGCSFGNMGYMSPSHFVPLASPGIISEGLKYMLSSNSPFYVKPRLNLDLIKWGYHFFKSSTEVNAKKTLHILMTFLD